MSNELLIWIGGFAITFGGALVATVWAMLNAKIDRIDKEAERARESLRERIADLYQKQEGARERSDHHHLEIFKALYERTCRHED